MATSRNAQEQKLAAHFPNIVREGFKKTSEEDYTYNCAAWAAGDSTQWWQPIRGVAGYFWPPKVPLNENLSSYVKAYSVTNGYRPCKDGTLEDGFEKIVIYIDDDKKFKHAARQMPDGTWTSKMGRFIDISHNTVDALLNASYGKVGQFMKRPRPKPSAV